MNITKVIIITLTSICVLVSCGNNKLINDQTNNDSTQASAIRNIEQDQMSIEAAKLVYQLVEDGGVVIEEFDAEVEDDNRYNKNNKIFIPKTIIKYSYKYIDSKGQKSLFVDSDTNNDNLWDLVEVEKADDKAINSVSINVLDGVSRMKCPDYNQTVIKYGCNRKDGDIAYMASMTGVIENEANLWMHPPRTKNFEVLELNPFPFIKKPFTVGNKWTWSLNIGSVWGDKNWKEWEGSIKNKYEYEIVEKTNLEIMSGPVECYKIVAKATSRIGETSLIAYFSEKYGFIKLDYTNINDTKIILEMTDFILYDTVIDSTRY